MIAIRTRRHASAKISMYLLEIRPAPRYCMEACQHSQREMASTRVLGPPSGWRLTTTLPRLPRVLWQARGVYRTSSREYENRYTTPPLPIGSPSHLLHV